MPDQEVRNQALTAALVGGALGAAAGASAGIWSARAIARRNGTEINAVMKTAATACELSHGPGCEDPRSPAQRGART